MAAYSIDLRRCVIDEGIDSRHEIAERFSVSQSWVRRLLQRSQDAESISPRPRKGGRTPVYDADGLRRLAYAVAARPDATLVELAEACGVACSTSATDRALRRLGITRRKSPSGPPSRTGPS